MKQSNDHKLPPSNIPRIQDGAELSRRQFLKVAGTAVVGGAMLVGPVPIADRMAVSKKGLTEDVNKALEIAKASPLFQEAVDTSKAFDFTFDVTAGVVKQSSLRDNFAGIVLPHASSVTGRLGADLVLTVNLDESLLYVVQYILGWSILNSLEVLSFILDERQPLYEETRSARLKYDTPPSLMRPRLEHQWSFWRPDSPPSRNEDLVIEGWPPEVPDNDYWYYRGCLNAGWTVDKAMPVFRGLQVGEYRIRRTEQSLIHNLLY